MNRDTKRHKVGAEGKRENSKRALLVCGEKGAKLTSCFFRVLLALALMMLATLESSTPGRKTAQQGGI